jgi:ribosomal protein L35
MPKQKSHGGISKKIKVRVGGTTKIWRTGGNHNTGKKNTNFNRKNRKGTSLSKGDSNRYKKVM